MARKPAIIKISDFLYRILSKLAKSKTLPACEIEHAKIFLLCADGLNNLQISYQVSIRQDSISKGRTFFKESLVLLEEVEAAAPSQLESQVSDLLADYPRPGQPLFLTNRFSKSLKLPAAIWKNTGTKPVTGV